MFLDTRPAELDAAGSEDRWREFRVGHPTEVLALLRRLRDGAHPVNLNGPGGQMLGTVLWSVDESRGRLNFSVEPDRPELPGLIEAGEAVGVAYLDSIKLQFELQQPLLVRAARGAVLQAEIPQVLYRFQRRQAFRVRVPEGTQACVRMRHPSLPDMTLTLRVLDVSIGGCALFVPQDVPSLQPGTRVANALMTLDADTRLETGLALQHATSIQPEQRGVRMGCAWIGLSPSAERALQRYIDQTQKRRRLLTLF